jgi:phosphate starvation-inducible membrane PsiE
MKKRDVEQKLDGLGDSLVSGFQMIALFVIGGTIVWSAVSDYVRMIAAGRAGLEDILLLFIYLELGTMLGIYFKTDRLPVLFLLYVAITALTRFLAIDAKSLPVTSVLAVTGSIFVLTLAVLVVQIATSRFAAVAEGDKPRARGSMPGEPLDEAATYALHHRDHGA